MTIELRSSPGCAHRAEARRLLEVCLAELGITDPIEERVGAFPSPTILIGGRDVMGSPASSEPSCRLDLPTRERILAALSAAGA